MMNIDLEARAMVRRCLTPPISEDAPALVRVIARAMRHAADDARDDVVVYLRNRGYPDLADEVAARGDTT